MNIECAIETEMKRSGFNGWILGCDEVGRGPLAGPATVACVAFPQHLDNEIPLLERLDDSKKLSAKKRVALVDEIKNAAAAWAIVDMSPEEIDRYNILQACLIGMRRAVEQVMTSLPGDDAVHVLVDGNKTIPDLAWPQTACVRGDARSWSVAAASIIAKVHRDDIMHRYASVYPGYGFEKNVGYPTAAHRAALADLGPTPIHRKSFHVKK